MEPEAPVRFSTTNCWPSCAPSCAAKMRATWSTDPPGGNGAMIRTGFAGHDCAKAHSADEASSETSIAIGAARFMQPPPKDELDSPRNRLAWAQSIAAEGGLHGTC